jgi:hypothetical protein
MDFQRVLSELVAFFACHDARWAAAGAWALHAYGLSRATLDLDVVTEALVQPALVEHLVALGYETLHVSAGFSNHLHAAPDWGRLDFIYVDEPTATLLFAGCGRTLELGGQSIRVPRPEHLAAMKAQAIRNDPSRLWRDLADVQHLLRLPGVDRAEMRGAFERAGLGGRFDEIDRP